MGLTEQSPPTLFIQTRSSAIHCASQRRKKNPFMKTLEAVYSQCKVEIDTTFGLLVAPVPGDALFDKQPAAWKEYSEPGVLDGIEPSH